MPNDIPKNQVSLDKMLSKRVRLPVLFEEGAEPPDTAVYRPIYEIRKFGFQFELRSLLHAIGCKTANLSMRDDDEAIRSAHLYTHALDMRRTDIGLRKSTPRDSDLLKNRSHEIGVGVTCLLAWHAWRFPWDKMEPIPAPGLRFDYRAKKERLEAIFEARGASS